MVICDFYYEIDETEGYVRVCQQPETLDHMTVLKTCSNSCMAAVGTNSYEEFVAASIMCILI